MTAPTRINEAAGHSSEPALQQSAQILESAAQLARAEVRLLWSHVRQFGARIAVALGLTWLASLLTQTAILMLAASPMIGASYGGVVLAACLAPALLFTVITWAACVKKWRGLSDVPSAAQSRTSDTALELPSGELERR